MKTTIECFAALGERLAHFGEDPATRRVAEAAVQANGWFTVGEVCRAMRAIAAEMLQPEALRRWLAGYPLPVTASRRVLVVMAGNIPAVGFFDLLCVVCSGHRCLWKPSGKDEVLLDYIVGELLRLAPRLPVARYDGTSAVDAVIATGSDQAERYFRRHYAGVPQLLRGSRRSVAVLSGHETAVQLAGLADDIWAYSGLGCRNVSLIFAPEGMEIPVKMPDVNPKYKNNYIQTKALLQMSGAAYRDLGAALLVEQPDFAKPLSVVAVARYRMLDRVADWLAEHDRAIQCVVTDCLPHPRRAEFGRAQSPALTDWPDGVDVLAWLAGLA